MTAGIPTSCHSNGSDSPPRRGVTPLLPTGAKMRLLPKECPSKIFLPVGISGCMGTANVNIGELEGGSFRKNGILECDFSFL